MSKVDPLSDVASTYAAISALNSNFEKIEEAFDNTLSRDGSSPNQMEADLDMNHRRIKNLPAPSNGSDPVRLSDIAEFVEADDGLSDLLQTTGGAGLVNEAEGGSVQDFIDTSRLITTSLADAPYNAVPSGSDQTALVQQWITDIGTADGRLFIPDGVKFNKLNLTGMKRVNISYRADDETSPSVISKPASGERFELVVTSSYPANALGGMAIERKLEGPLHPAWMINVTKSLSGGDGGLGTGQTRNNPARTSLNFQSDGVDFFRVLNEEYGVSFSNLTSTRMHTWRRQVTLVKTTGNWTASVGDKIIGNASTAVGFVKSGGGTDTIIVEWYSGIFTAAETLRNDTTATANMGTVQTATFANSANAGLGFGSWNGAVTVGEGSPGKAAETFVVFGNTMLVPTENLSLNKPYTVTKPTLWFGTAADSTTDKLGIQLDPTSGTSGKKRLKVARNTTRADELMPVTSKAEFFLFDGDLVYDTVDARNIDSLVKVAATTGRYTINFVVDMAGTTYHPWGSPDAVTMPGWKVQFCTKAVGSVEMRVFDETGTLADVPTSGRIDYFSIGGDHA